MFNKFLLGFCSLFVFYNHLTAQILTQSTSLPQSIYRYPQDYFRYPLDLPPSTAGSFGELRPNHFHSGLDFKTNQRTGYPIHAVADGYVARIRVQYGGFGLAVYIAHPNGYTSVYGHLDHLTAELTKIIKDYQYKNQTWEADILLEPTQVPLQKGDVFAWSGNAGASGGPHLHFELRDTQTEQTINAQLFGLTIPDRVPPTIYSIAAYHLNRKPFSENTTKQFVAVTGSAGNYRLKEASPIKLSGESAFGITTNDMNSSSLNHNGIYSIQLNADGKVVYVFTVDRFAFDQTRAINSHIDYPAFLTSGRWVQKSFVDPGNQIGLYNGTQNRGVINFNDDAFHDMEYIVKDIAGNTSVLKFQVKSSPPAITETVAAKGSFFKFDQQNIFSTELVKVIIPAGSLYDNLNFIYSTLPRKTGAYSVVHRIHNRFTQLNNSIELWIKPDVSLGANADKAVIVNTGGGCFGGVFKDGYVKASIREFGNYYIAIDTIAPVITPVNISEGKNMSATSNMIFRISDNLSGIKTYKAYIDGQWVLLEHDYKTKTFRYFFDEHCPAGKHKLEMVVTDLKDNVKKLTLIFYR
ncbi:M23 family metallopeptidase [Mucilaginibacter arboris]|uniref:Peptidoglycan DD-metalloendopeptidase family protein n=1 Tax=Mucilaginibacter arboris TaxID=2682090 RepID=A0A7K1SUE9_9SPHI|nr:M23 family metallopeptidase [Mucilaginibacter arboris]MVN20946.1 peptidoglycan DD-metalloendopeptidase family protein [Mucilaginibacter arboris]